MEQRGVGENAVKVRVRQIQIQEVLPPYFAARCITRHGHEVLAAIEANHPMALCRVGIESSPGPAAEIEDGEWWRDFDMLQQRRDVLRDVVIASAFPKILGVRVV